jgi:hypothetical protein
MSRQVIKKRQLTHIYAHHLPIVSATNKVIGGINIELSNLSYIQISSDLIIWVISYRTKNLARLSGVAHSVIWPAR